MALSPYKTYFAGDILTASDLNASLNHPLTNALTLISPLTGTLDADGNIIILDADADSNMRAGTDDVLTFTLQGFASFIMDGDVASPVNGITFTTSATTVAPSITAHGETNVSLELAAKGTGNINLRAGGAETAILVAASGSGADVALRLQGKGTSKVRLGDANLNWPDVDGTANFYLKTDGAGTLSWANPIEYPSGTRVIFQQTAAPTGYTKASAGAYNDAALRVVTGAASTGGVQTFSAVMAQTNVGAHTLVTAEIPSHQHLMYYGSLGAAGAANGVTSQATDTGNGSNPTALTGGGGSHQHSITLDMKYADVIIGQKD